MLKSPPTMSSLTILSLLLGASSAFAQTNDNRTQASSKGVLEEVIVTAQHREQSMQDAAVAIQAYDQEALMQSGMESAQDLGKLSPSLGISAGGGPLTSFFIRGVGALTVNPLTDSAVAQNVDGIYLGRSSGAAGQALYDLERVELMKGPQGTLYGRNATGGVVNYIPQKPVLGENSGYLQGEFGNYSKVGVQGAANISLAETAAIRLSGNKLERDGYSDDGSNDQDSYSVRAQLLVEPNENLSVRFAADYSEINGMGNGGDLVGTYNNTPGSLAEFIPSGLPIGSGPTAAGANAIRTGVLHTPSFAFFKPIDTSELYQDISFTGYMAEINYQTDAGTLTFIPAYRESEQDYQFSGPGFAPAKTLEENNQTSFELRFATDLDGPLNGIIGAFYIDEEISTSGVFAQNYTSPIQNYDNGGDSWAIFGQGTFDVTDTFRLNAGVRYTEDSKYARGISDTFVTFCGGAPAGPNFLTPPRSFANGCASGAIPAHAITSDRDEFIADLVARGEIAPGSTADDGVFPLLAPGGISPNLAVIVNVGDGFLESELDYSEVTYRVGVEWDWGPSNLLYAGFETGYRAGGVDLSVVSPTYDPEYIDAFTIGSKNRFLENTLQVNAELFYWKYDGQQVTYFTTLEGASAFPIANADATIQGIDVDFIWAATDNTTISGNFQFSDAEYNKLQLISDPGRGRFGCASSGVNAGLESFDCSGNSLLYNPDFGADLSVNHVIDFENSDLSLTANASYRDERQTNFLFLKETVSDAYTTFNLDATLSLDDARWEISAFVRNLTDERVSANTNVSNRGLSYAIYSPPKTYGVRLRANF
ncbi:TonB-dependent receptor [Pseudomaricurvus alcaniphilus]|uniref:TonB-dependent receptor n=1 Tax=Pseudomaricurvus alcaniphilus TaxID=1166482 RepID=UPI001FB79662|nr:TonB-dependent receptor [Pseudomaricurvus alcaniphilus]